MPEPPAAALLRDEPGAAVGCRNLTVHYWARGQPAVRDVSLAIAPGERALLLGPSGSGKSTLAYALSGIIPRSIEARVRGEVWRPERVGVLFQDPEAQFCMLTVGDEVAFSLENRRVPPEEMPGRIAASLAAVGLDVPPETPIAHLSGGMKQRLALAAVLALEPEALFLDEPTAQLDPPGARQALDAVRRAAQGRTVLIVEHNLDGVVDWVDRLILLGPDGRLLADGSPAAVLRRHEAEIERFGIWRPRSWYPAWTGVLDGIGDPAEGGTGAPPGEPLVELEDAAAAYGGRTVWRGVSLRVYAGEWLAVVGPNGSGKSSLLRILAGLQRPAEGRVRAAPALRGRRVPAVGYVFQNPEHQFVTDRVADEIAFAPRLAGWDEARVRAAVSRVAGELRLEGLEDVHPFRLSEGQKRRLSVAGALIVGHRLLLLDEPTFGQDAATARELIRWVAERRREGAAVVMATHDLDLARAVATRLIVLAGGRVRYDGPPGPFLDDPRRLAEAGLLAGAVPEPPPEVSGAAATDDGGGGAAAGLRSLLRAVNPAAKLLLHLGAMLALLGVGDPRRAAALGAVPAVAGLALGGIRPAALLVRLVPFVLLGASSFWVLAAYGEGTVLRWQWLWFRVTEEGLRDGAVVALRMLAFGLYGAVFTLTTDLTELVMSLMQQLRLSPRWAYGVLAGLRFAPLFRDELEQIRAAHRVRGADRQPGLRGRLRALGRYAIPLLAQAVRRAERVAVALEARGFDGSWNRTFRRRLRLGWPDLAYAAALAGLCLGAWWLGGRLPGS